MSFFSSFFLTTKFTKVGKEVEKLRKIFGISTPKVGLNAQMFAKARKYEQKQAVKNVATPRPLASLRIVCGI